MKATWIKTGALTGVLAAGVVLGVLAQSQPSQTRREPQFENENVRVWKSIIMPNQPLSLHRHDFGRTIVVLKGGSRRDVPSPTLTIAEANNGHVLPQPLRHELISNK